jgi:uncharacterized delta-60 repeat protein
MGNKAIIHFPNKVFSSRTIWPIILFLAFFIITSLPQDVHSASFDVGTVDKDFVPDVDGKVFTMDVKTDGKIIVGGTFSIVDKDGLNERKNIAMLNFNGKLDLDFQAANADNEVYALAIQADGNILIGGAFKKINDFDRRSLAMLTPAGLVHEFRADVDGLVYSVVPLADGKILVGGYFTSIKGQAINNMARLNDDGTLDDSFKPNIDYAVTSIVVLHNEKILVGGAYPQQVEERGRGLDRLNSDGSLDKDFKPNIYANILSLVVQADGKILLGGLFLKDENLGQNEADGGLARLNPDGTLNKILNKNQVQSIALQDNGKILAGGPFGVAQFDSDGTLNNNFNLTVTGEIYKIALQPDGKMLLGGAFSKVNGLTRNNLARLSVRQVSVLPGVMMLLLDD